MTREEIREIAQNDHRTHDTTYNEGLKIIKEGVYGWYHPSVQYWLMCNNLEVTE